MLRLVALSLALLTNVHAFQPIFQPHPFKQKITKLMTFGDSYTDITQASFTLWPIYAADYGHLSFLDFARSGATCDQNLTPRTFPAVVQDEIPAFLNATNNGKNFNAEETLFTLWIGTNDVGVGELITGQAVPGVSLVNTTTCAVGWVQTMYNLGARNFFFQNVRAQRQRSFL